MVRKGIGHWQVTSRDSDVTQAHLPALRFCSRPVRRVWFLQIWLASPRAVTCRDSSSLTFQSPSTWGTGYHVTVLAVHPTFFLSMEIAVLSSCLCHHLDLPTARVCGVPLAPASLGKLIIYFLMVTEIFFWFPYLCYNQLVLGRGRRHCAAKRFPI